MEIKDFTVEEKEVLKFVSICREFTLQEFCRRQEFYPELKVVDAPEKTLNALVKKGMARMKEKKDGAEAYQFLYGISMSFKDGKDRIYDAEQAEQDAIKLRYEICP